MTRTKMSTVVNKTVKISCKSVMTQVFTVVGLIFEIVTSIEASEDYFEAYPHIS